MKLPNHLKNQTSPYLLQHAENPVDWYPWGEEAFSRAREEDKPVFLSIGYSTCHWCHVMAHESFEDGETAEILNRHFVSVKVDREERPDVDAIYMPVCQAFTGNGGWPASIFMTADKKPFFAGTYFPKRPRGGMIGFPELLTAIHDKWETDRPSLLKQADEVVARLNRSRDASGVPKADLIDAAAELYRRSYDRKNGGFGRAPKFPAAHSLLFLLTCYERRGDESCLKMAEKTLLQMYRGGLFDHIGFGFFRYSTDERFLIPHFEKMLYDNALLIMACCKAYTAAKKAAYLEIAEKTADFVLRELTSPEGGFYSALDADSGGGEGRYYLFTPEELTELLGEKDGLAFCRHFGITAKGNFEGKSNPNLLLSDPSDRSFDGLLETVRKYRGERCALHTDDKILTSWNALMISAMCRLYQASGKEKYLGCARRADRFIMEKLCEGETLFVSFREGKRGVVGFLDDYAALIFAQLALYGATLETGYLDRAKRLCREAIRRFADEYVGGFYLYGEGNEPMILRPKECYDGALPSGNSLMAWDLVRLSQLAPDGEYTLEAKRQLDFMSAAAAEYPAGHAMFLLALLDHETPPPRVTAVAAEREDAAKLPLTLPPDAAVILLRGPTEEYPLKNGRTTFYICKDHSCLPPVNEPDGSI